MIIPEDTATSKTPRTEEGEIQGRSPQPVSQYTPLQGESPPAYYGSGTNSSHLPPNIPQQPYSAEGPITFPYRYGRSPAERFFRALIVAWIVWALIALFVQSFVVLVHWISNDWKDGGKMDPRFDYDVPSGIALSDCIQGSEWARQLYPEVLPTETSSRNSWESPLQGALVAAQTTFKFDLPLKSAKTFLIARGQLSAGIVDVITSSTQPSNTVTVRVNVQYAREEARNLAKACKLAHKVGQEPEGVGIFTPRWRDGRWREGSQMFFQTTVILPEVAAGNAPLFVRGFEADAPNFSYQFADLNEKVHFGSLILKGSNNPVDVKSLSATIVEVRNQNGYIKGVFNTTKSLVLETTNSPIEVDVGLRSAQGSKPTFNAHTSNGPIDAAISLLSDHPKSGGTYTVAATASNGDILLQFPAQPINTKLYLTASTSNGPARVDLNPAYEGDFVLQSTAAIVIREGRDVEDPSGAGRRRLVDYKTGKPEGTQMIVGSVRWDTGAQRWLAAPGHGDGRVEIRNINAPLTFEL